MSTAATRLAALAACASASCKIASVHSDPDHGRDHPISRRYVCHRANDRIEIDGHLGELAWRIAPQLNDFVDIEGAAKPLPVFDIDVWLLWDDLYLYVGVNLEEPHVWATLVDRDAIVWHENDFEVFIDPDGDGLNYHEFEVNARNTMLDLLMDKPYRQKGSARLTWNAGGLRWAVAVDGTLNNPNDVDRGWSVEMAIPFAALAEFSTVPVPPRPGDTWRMNFSRVQWDLEVIDGAYHKIEGRREHNWVWSPQGVIDMHLPDRWGLVTFEE